MVVVAIVTLVALISLRLLLRKLGPPWRERAGWVVTAIGIGLAASFGTLVWTSLCRFPPLPALLRGLPENGAGVTGSRQLTHRLQVEFPIGSAESKLVRELWLEGFTPVSDLGAAERFVSFTRMGDFIHDICRADAQVRWSADNGGHLVAVTGGYWRTCF
jgi:hypothetical protein